MTCIVNYSLPDGDEELGAFRGERQRHESVGRTSVAFDSVHVDVATGRQQDCQPVFMTALTHPNVGRRNQLVKILRQIVERE